MLRARTPTCLFLAVKMTKEMRSVVTACNRRRFLRTHCHSVGLAAEGEVVCRHGFQMPVLDALLLESLIPFLGEFFGNWPPMLGAPEAHANQMALGRWILSVHKALPTVQNGQIVDEMDVASLGLDLHLRRLCNGFNGVQSLHLTGSQGGQVLRTGMSLVSKKSRSAKVHDEL